MTRLAAANLVALLVLVAPARAQDLTVTLVAEKALTGPSPVCVPLTVTAEQAKWTEVVSNVGLGQLTAPGLLTEHLKPAFANGVRRDLHIVLPGKLEAGQSITLPLTQRTGRIELRLFSWKDTKGEHMDLFYDGRPVLRYMYKAYNDSNPDIRNKTYKVFHHLFDPKGTRLVTNGGYTDEGITDSKKLLYPHHRGLQMGFNKVTYGDGKKKADTWHCQKDDHQSHEGFLQTEQGPILGRHRVAIDWHGAKKELILKEEREMTVYKLPGGTLVEFASRLKSAGGKVKLDGDPQHAGFQFRAHNDVAVKTASQTYYLRPDGKDKPGATRNWPGNKTHVNLPWNCMSFVLGDQRFTACYLDHPQNPHEARHSERDYGRFGCYFEHDLTEERPLVLNYRVWLQEGEMTLEQAQALSTAFTAPPKVK